MRKHKIRLLILIIITLTISIGFTSNTRAFTNPISDSQQINLLPIGTTASDWTLEDILTDSNINFYSFKGKVVLVDFFATWCGPCITAMPEFLELYNSYSSQDLVIVSISVDPEIEADLEIFAADNNMIWKVAIDTEELGTYYGVQTIPTIYIFDQDSKVQYAQAGVVGASTLKNAIDDLLGDPATPAPTTRPQSEPLGFWGKKLVLDCIAIGIRSNRWVCSLQRRRVLVQNEKIRKEKIAEKKRKARKRSR